MGCTYSACWPRRGQGDDEALRPPPYSGSNVLSELGQWKERVRQIVSLESHEVYVQVFGKAWCTEFHIYGRRPLKGMFGQ